AYLLALTVPAIAPPSHALAPAYARLVINVHVSIPWWPDGRYQFIVQTRIRPPQWVVRSPTAITSRAKPGEPRLEIGLASSRLIAGEALVGSCALFHMDDQEPRDIAISFLPRLALRDRFRDREQFGMSFTVTVTLPAGSAGTSVPF